MNSQNAFSLIELMVVIAIVAILASIAVPAYKGYFVKSEIGKALPVVDSLVAKSIEYGTVNGVAPNALQLGLDMDTNYTGQQNGDTMFNTDLLGSENIQDIEIAWLYPTYNDGNGYASDCRQSGVVGFRLGESSRPSNLMSLSYQCVWSSNDQAVVNKYCYYTAQDLNGNVLSGDVISGLNNGEDPDAITAISIIQGSARCSGMQ